MGFITPHGKTGSRIAGVARTVLGIALVFAGTGHLAFARREFLAQVPSWVPLDGDLVVVLSGVVEIVLGIGLVVFVRFQRQFGLASAIFFIAIFPGNIAQFLGHIDAFGLTTDLARGIRLLFQPLLVVWALWSTRALSLFAHRRHN